MKILIIAESTARQTFRQPLLFLIGGLAGLMIFFFPQITLFTFGRSEQLNMMREMGLSTITIAGLLFTIFASTLAITEDLERKSALTLLCKPVHRYEFILGKFLGISFSIFCVFAFLTMLLLGTLWLTETSVDIGATLKGETGSVFDIPKDFLGYISRYAPPILKGVVLSYFMILLLNAISLAGATRLPMLPNLGLCLLIFLAGNFSSYLYELVAKAAVGDLKAIQDHSLFTLMVEYPLVGIARIFYAIIPNLESFNISNAVGYGLYVSPKYILLTLAYGITYTAIALLTALVSFEHRELM
ncbi:MAG: hypothetical protein QF473_14655 [Planctomycetota bacterium]|jgi:hypothetical protein|nr:hypothetical protein [Planctomycetota bacterium]MDP6502518.1 hypothetical protein [Planctomycetota bacterium]